MRDSELLDYMEESNTKIQLPDLKLIKREITGKGFSRLEYEFSGGKLSFVIDRGYIEGEIIKQENYTSFDKLAPSLKNLEKSVSNIDLLIDTLNINRNTILSE